MLVHFTTSLAALERDVEMINKITGAIYKLDYHLAIDWVQPTYYRLKRGAHKNPREWEEECNDRLDAIARADVVIIEASDRGFGIGFETAMALQHKKPILLMLRKGATQQSWFALSYKHPLIIRREYDEDNLESVIAEFLKQNTISLKDLRFNFVADRQVYNYLRWKSKRINKPKSEILRDLILKDIDRKNS